MLRAAGDCAWATSRQKIPQNRVAEIFFMSVVSEADKIEKKWKMEKGKARLMPNGGIVQLNDGYGSNFSQLNHMYASQLLKYASPVINAN
jgi:hypothetical protein